MISTNNSVYVILILLITQLSGCSLMHPAPSIEPAVYNLNYFFSHISTPSRSVKHAQRTLLVMPTQVSPALNDKEMIYITKQHRISHFSKNEWVAPPAKMLTALITKALQDNGYFYAVITAPFTGSIDLRLYTHLYQLQQVFLQKPSVVHLSLAAQLVNAHTGKVIATKQFQLVEPAPQDNPYGGVLAANNAVHKLLRQLVDFSARHS